MISTLQGHLLPYAVAALVALCTDSGVAARVPETTQYSFTGGNEGAMPLAPVRINDSGPGSPARGGYRDAWQARFGKDMNMTHQFTNRHPTNSVARCRCILSAAAAIICGGIVTAAHAQVAENVLYAFTGGSDGASPIGALLADTTGHAGSLRGLYGTTSAGDTGNCEGGCGSIFALKPPKQQGGAWSETTLWNFSGGADNGQPVGGLFAATNHITEKTPLYGTTSYGANTTGTVFRLVGGTLTTLWTFTGGADGELPQGNVIGDNSGGLYVPTITGTAADCGAIDQITPPKNKRGAWTEATLYGFPNYIKGCGPTGTLIMDDSGALYGPTIYAGKEYNGNVFKLTPRAGGKNKWTEQNLYTFKGGHDGSMDGAVQYNAAVTVGANGVIYGTTTGGGAPGCGVVYAITPPGNGDTKWSEQVLYTFSGGSDGCLPISGVLIDGAGALYGTTSGDDGINGSSTIFKLAPPAGGQGAWTFTTLWTFSGGNGSAPEGTLVADNAGNLYGTTYVGGNPNCVEGLGCGVVFQITGTGFVVK